MKIPLYAAVCGSLLLTACAHYSVKEESGKRNEYNETTHHFEDVTYSEMTISSNHPKEIDPSDLDRAKTKEKAPASP